MDDNNILPLLAPPSEDESKGYYRGLPSQPTLVGRTSSGITAWPPPLMPLDPNYYVPPAALPERFLGPVGRHPIRSSWETVLEQIMEAIDGLPWTSIDLVRIGLENEAETSWPVVVWVGVKTADLSWDNIVAPALRSCRRILDAANLTDVECEIRVSEVPISPTLVDDSLGTLGFFVTLAGSKQDDLDTPVWAVTCRHVALPSARLENKTHHSTDRDARKEPWEISLPNGSEARRHINFIKFELDATERYLLKAIKNGSDDIPDIKSRLRDYNVLYEKIRRRMAPEDRVVGHAALAPALRKHVSQDKHGRDFCWTRDWCLVRIDRQRLPNNGNNLTNQLDYLQRSGFRVELHNRGLHVPDEPFLSISGVVPVETIHPRPDPENRAESVSVVGKNGAASGLTLGKPTGIKLIVRYPNPVSGEPKFETDEWAIMGIDEKVFSKMGDSGSLGFTLDERAAGLLTGGCGGSTRPDQTRNDLTYATPLEFVLRDIEEQLGEKIRLL